MTTVLSDDRPTARKDHQCGECLGVIPAGTRYVNQRNLNDGRAYTWKSHELCHALFCDSYWRFSLDDDDWGSEHAWEALSEWWSNFVASLGAVGEQP